MLNLLKLWSSEAGTVTDSPSTSTVTFSKPAVHHHGSALLPTLGAIEGDLAALHHPRYEGTPLLVCAVVSFPWKIMETSWWAGELLVVVKCQNIINHPDQYMAQHGCIVKQSLLCHSLLGDHYVSLQWQTVKQSITAIKTSHARLLHSLMHNTTMETNRFWNQKWKWSSRPFKLQSKWYTHRHDRRRQRQYLAPGQNGTRVKMSKTNYRPMGNSNEIFDQSFSF